MRIVAMVAVGVLYGVLLRGWMRFVSTEPEFSWSGTGYIVGIFAVLGLMAGLVDMGRRLGWHGRLVTTRIVGGVLALGCFMAAGLAMFPTIVPASLGVARSDWWKPFRVALVAGGAAVAVTVVMTMAELSLQRRLVALTLYAGLCAVEVALLSRILAPSLPRGSIRDATPAMRATFVALPLAAVFVLVIAVTGVPST